jgi:hypothetical protein
MMNCEGTIEQSANRQPGLAAGRGSYDGCFDVLPVAADNGHGCEAVRKGQGFTYLFSNKLHSKSIKQVGCSCRQSSQVNTAPASTVHYILQHITLHIAAHYIPYCIYVVSIYYISFSLLKHAIWVG